MATDLGVVQGLIELKDDFTSQLGLAEAALANFSKQNQESLVAVAGVVGLATAAFTAAAAAVYNLGQRGADINDVAETFTHFSGSTAEAEKNLANLRAGVKGTIDNFELLKDGAHLLSADVKLTADDFGILGQAAFVLQNRGLGGTKEQLDLVSEALVTGRTRALSMALGVVDAGDAEENYARKLGLTKDLLTDTEKVEAHREQVMKMLQAAVKDAGEQTRDFGEEIEFAKAQVINWTDSFAQAIAKSPALLAGFRAIEQAIGDAFGSNNQESINTVLEYVKKGAILIVDFGLASVEMARVVNTAWSAVKVAILGTETVLVGIAEGVAGAIALTTRAAASLPGATEGMKAAAAAAASVAENLTAMTNSLAEQTAEAAKGVVGASEFDKTLDKLGGTLFNVRDAISGAKAAADENNQAMDVAASNARKLAQVGEELNKIHGDRAKLWEIEKKSLLEVNDLWNDYFSLRVKNSRTTTDAQKADIESWFDNEVAKLNDNDAAWQLHYDTLRAVADEKLRAVELDWDSVKDKSLEALRQTADRARETYNEMIFGSLHFSREVLEEQRQKMVEAEMAARGMGSAYVKAQEDAAEAAAKHKKELEDLEKAARKAADAARAIGGSFEVNKTNLERLSSDMHLDIGRVLSLAKKGYSFSEILQILQGMSDDSIPPHGPKIPGFAEGGIVMVGERGPEAVRLPFGSQVFPTGTMPREATSVTNHIYINDTLRDAARKVADEIQRRVGQGRLLPAAG